MDANNLLLLVLALSGIGVLVGLVLFVINTFIPIWKRSGKFPLPLLPRLLLRVCLLMMISKDLWIRIYAITHPMGTLVMHVNYVDLMITGVIAIALLVGWLTQPDGLNLI